MQKQALIFGATGAVGRELLELCLDGDRYTLVTVIAPGIKSSRASKRDPTCDIADEKPTPFLPDLHDPHPSGRHRGTG